MSDLDESRLSAWLASAVPDAGAFSVQKFSGGQSNPTYRLVGASRDLVLRRKPFGALLPSAHAIEREFRLLTALETTDLRVPHPIALCEDPAVIGVPFYLMEMVTGRNYFNATLPDVPKAERRGMYASMVDTLARLHNIEPAKVGLADYGRPGNYFGRQVERWTKQYRAAQTTVIPEMERLIAWLPTNLPAPDRVSIIHGDYRIDNLIYHESSPAVAAVLDWELSTLGDPLADFGNLAMNWILPSDGRSALDGLDLASEGLPTLDETIARYCLATKRDGIASLHWLFAYNLFRGAGILQGIRKRLLDGNASSEDAAEIAAKVEPFARAGWQEARKAGAPA
ncbi:phosphotransferase family protein [Bradyrhizobium sp. ma5]|uniref:phosphotransferase family protein n=1 Tax=Bradyrhizobium sp. ma5 TaxID=3344828 RepID=UPI0035D445E2